MKHLTIIANISVAVASSFYDRSVDDLFNNPHKRLESKPRHLAMYLLKTISGRSNREIGEMFSRDRTTVGHALEQVTKSFGKEDLASLIKHIKILSNDVARLSINHLT